METVSLVAGDDTDMVLAMSERSVRRCVIVLLANDEYLRLGFLHQRQSRAKLTSLITFFFDRVCNLELFTPATAGYSF